MHVGKSTMRNSPEWFLISQLRKDFFLPLNFSPLSPRSSSNSATFSSAQNSAVLSQDPLSALLSSYIVSSQLLNIYTYQFVRWLLRMYLWYLEKIWRKSSNPDTNKSVGNEFVSARLGRVGQKCRLLAVGPTCCRHVGNFPSQDGDQKRMRGQISKFQRRSNFKALSVWQEKTWVRCLASEDRPYQSFLAAPKIS